MSLWVKATQSLSLGAKMLLVPLGVEPLVRTPRDLRGHLLQAIEFVFSSLRSTSSG